MQFMPLTTLVLAAAALYGANRRFGRLPTTIGVTVWALLGSLAIIGTGALGSPVQTLGRGLMARVHFRETLLEGMLAPLLFAGALEVDFDALLDEKAFRAAQADGQRGAFSRDRPPIKRTVSMRW
jgi:CPA1 family monovalent cation:H+ antiporter